MGLFAGYYLVLNLGEWNSKERYSEQWIVTCHSKLLQVALRIREYARVSVIVHKLGIARQKNKGVFVCPQERLSRFFPFLLAIHQMSPMTIPGIPKMIMIHISTQRKEDTR